jgi:hypothetical protein
VSRSGKLAGKTEWAGRRRPATRKAGYNATAAVQLETEALDGYRLEAQQSLVVRLNVPASHDGEWAGFGGWFAVDDGIDVSIDHPSERVLTKYQAPNWNKVGTIELGAHDEYQAVLRFAAQRRGTVTIYNMLAGGIQQHYLDATLSEKPEVLKNQWSYAPETNFYDPTRPGSVEFLDAELARVPGQEVVLKSCNRCARFLPINVDNERATLSFSNHCIANHRRPCRHSSFGRIAVKNSDEFALLEYGFQLECRFCKKFEVNLALNPQRTAGQMKEDGARRRHFELLLDYLYGGSPQLRYKNETGRDLASVIFARFNGRCFKCGTAFARENEMHLDHTRPLSMLWPLDSTATALCSTHNSEKRDRSPAEFYTADELERLAKVTGVSLEELLDPGPNVEAIDLLGERLDWFYTEFLRLPRLQDVRDGKRTGDLVVKALRRVLANYPGGPPFKL